MTRGICKCDEDGKLISIEETYGIEREGDTVVGLDAFGNKRSLSLTDTASMNIMGFTPSIFPLLEKKFLAFLNNLDKNDPLKAEFLIPNAVNELLKDGEIDVEVVKTSANWFGVTFKEDRGKVKASLNDLIEHAVYPTPLWR